MNALDPKIDKGPWTPQQDRKLLENIDTFGKGEGEHGVTFQESSVRVAPYSFFENSKKMVTLTIVCCHGNSLQHTHMNGKEIPGVLLIFTVNARRLNPKLKQIVHC